MLKRRIIGWTLALSLANLTFSPTAVFAASATRAESERNARETEILEVYARDGSIEVQMAGPNVISRVGERLGATGGRVSKAGLADSLRAAVMAHRASAKSLKGQSGESFGKNMLIIADALEANSDSAYHKIVTKLPVRIVRAEMTNARGQKGIRTTFWSKNRPRASYFRAAVKAQESVKSESEKARSSGPSQSASVETTCEWYDADEDYLYQGECATQQEIDDAIAIAVALEADMNAAVAAVEAQVSEDGDWCEEGEVLSEALECEEPLDESSPAPADVTRSTTKTFGTMRVENVLGADVMRPIIGGPAASDPEIATSALASCADKGWAFTAAMANYGYRAFRLGVLVTAVFPPAGAIADAAILLGIGAIAAIGVGIALRDCLSTR